MPRATIRYAEPAENPALWLAFAFSILAMLPFLGVLMSDISKDLNYDYGSVRYVPAPNPTVRFVGF